jgi:hypothetical protein
MGFREKNDSLNGRMTECENAHQEVQMTGTTGWEGVGMWMKVLSFVLVGLAFLLDIYKARSGI